MCARHDRRRRDDVLEALLECHRLFGVQRLEVRHQHVAAVRQAERTHVNVDRARAAVLVRVAALELGAQDRQDPRRREKPRQRQRRARELERTGRPVVERHRVDEREPRHAGGMAHRQVLRDPAAQIVAHDRRVRDAQRVQEPDDALGVPSDAEVAPVRRIAAAVAEEVDHHHAVAVGDERRHVAPQVRRGGEPVDQDDGLTGTSRSRGVIVQARATYIDELTPHVRSWEQCRVKEAGAGRAAGSDGDAVRCRPVRRGRAHRCSRRHARRAPMSTRRSDPRSPTRPPCTARPDTTAPVPTVPGNSD